MLRKGLVLGMAVAACSAATGSAAAGPQLTIREQCPGAVEWTATGLAPGAIVDYAWTFGNGLGGAADAVAGADSNGTLGPMRLQLPPQRVKFVSVSLHAVFPSDAPVPAVTTLKKPCKHADKKPSDAMRPGRLSRADGARAVSF